MFVVPSGPQIITPNRSKFLFGVCVSGSYEFWKKYIVVKCGILYVTILTPKL